MKKMSILILLTLMSCTSGTPLPPFGYQNDSRMVIEMNLVDENGLSLKNQSAELFSIRYSEKILVKIDYSKDDGKIFISVPKSNYKYSLLFENKKIISLQNYSGVTVLNVTAPQTADVITDLNETYYNFGNVILKNN